MSKHYNPAVKIKLKVSKITLAQRLRTLLLCFFLTFSNLLAGNDQESKRLLNVRKITRLLYFADLQLRLCS